MKQKITIKIYNISAFLATILFILIFSSTGYGSGWKAGVARSVITPEEPIWMAGYAARDRPSDGTLHDLWAKALALEDATGQKVVLITTDLLGFPQAMSNRIRDQIAKEYGLNRSQVVLSSSHTHSGPVLMDALFNIYPLDEQRIAVIRKYSSTLEKKIVNLTGEALRSMVPAQLFSENGIARFQVNRRHNSEKTVLYQSEIKGPSDHAVPVIKVADASDNLMAIVFGYACHTTVLTINQFSGDYAGFAQIELEKLYPGATAMFFLGAGADQNPLPRRSVPLAQQYGRELAAAVDRVLNEGMKKLDPMIKTAYAEIDLSFSRHPTMEQLIEIEKEAQGYHKRWAADQINILKKNGKLLASYPYPLQVWKLGDQPVFILGGELVIEYALELKKLFGHDIFVMGYANDVMAYIPSETILKEGLYEGETSQAVYGMPAKWETGIQEKIINELKQMAVKAGIGQVGQ